MGTVFQVPWTRLEAWPGGLRVLSDNGFTVAAFALGDGATSLDELAAKAPQRLALIFGTDGGSWPAPTWSFRSRWRPEWTP